MSAPNFEEIGPANLAGGAAIDAEQVALLPDLEKGKPDPPGAPGGWRLVTRQQLAELMGVHPDTITDYARADMPVITRGGRGKESEYDAVACLAWQRRQIGKSAKEDAQTRAYNAQAAINELKLAQQRGDLLAREIVTQEGQHYTKAWSAKVRGFARRLVNAGIVPREKEASVLNECIELLNEISSWKTLADVKRAGKDDQE